MSQFWTPGRLGADSSFLRKAWAPLGQSPFAYHEMAFPAPRNSTDLDSLTLRQLHDYTVNESPRVREITGFRRRWQNHQSFRRCKGLCAQFLNSPSPPRYRKSELEVLRSSKFLIKGQTHKSMSVTKRRPNAVSEIRKVQATPSQQLAGEIKEFERRLPSLRPVSRFVYKLQD